MALAKTTIRFQFAMGISMMVAVTVAAKVMSIDRPLQAWATSRVFNLNQ